jgi:hypothetical protein
VRVADSTNRRGFLRALVRNAGEAIADVAGAARDEQPDPPRRPPEPPPQPEGAVVASSAPLLRQAPAVTRTLTLEEVLDLAAEEGLEARRDALRDLARASTRLTPALEAPATSTIGRPEESAHRDGTVATVADIDLSDPALPAGVLPDAGRLVVRIVVPRRAAVARCGRAQVSIAEDEAAPEGLAVLLSTEVTLPRVWATPVQALELSDDEHERYVRLRERLAELQGVPADDDGADGIARHHLLGYPTETSGAMPLMCELVARGLDPETSPAEVSAEIAGASARWRLLLQLTHAERSGVILGPGVTRLFLWISRDRLARHDLSEVWAIAR